MSLESFDANSPWHAGEKALQARLGVAASMEAFGRRVIRDHMPEQHRDFYRQLPFLIVGSVDATGRAWASVLSGRPGFVDSPDARELAVRAVVDAQDPAFANLKIGSGIGVLGIELHSRRRNRLNGVIAARDGFGFSIAVEQTFGNCPQYIQLRHGLAAAADVAPTPDAELMTELDDEARATIAAADTFFVASYLPRDGQSPAVDVSHRGGQAGFVRIEGNRLSIPDFAGNLHFNTLGNLLQNPLAGLLFIDFDSGDLLQVSGRTELTLDGPEITAFQGAERIWHVQIERVVRRPRALPLRWRWEAYSPNSLMTGTWPEALSRLQAEAQRDQWRPMQVLAKHMESAEICSFLLKPVAGETWSNFQAGQHLFLKLPITDAGRSVIRAYSVSSAPSDSFLRISVKRDGRASKFLHEQIAVGAVLDVKAPRGHFVLNAEDRRPVVLLAAGVGITPLLSMLREVSYQNLRLRRKRSVLLIQAARHGRDLAFGSELQSLLEQQNGAIRHLRILSQPESGLTSGLDFDYQGRIDANYLGSLGLPDDADYYLCGPSAFSQDCYDLLRGLGIADARIHAEAFGPSSLQRSGADHDASIATARAAEAPVAVLFQRSGKEARWTKEAGSLLDLAEQRGLTPEFSCRGGSCGACSTRILQGQVAYARPVAIKTDTQQVLICCAVPAATPESVPLILDL